MEETAFNLLYLEDVDTLDEDDTDDDVDTELDVDALKKNLRIRKYTSLKFLL